MEHKILQAVVFMLASFMSACSIFAPDEEVTQDILVAYAIPNNGSGRYDSDIWLADFDIEGDRSLLAESTDDYSPHFDPDGSGLYFISTRAGNRDLFFVDTAGNNLTQLTSDRWIESYDISPHGDKLIFVDNNNDGRNVYEVGVNGGATEYITRGYNPVYTDGGNAIIFLNSAGSRNLRKVTFGSSDTLEITTAAPSSGIVAVAGERERFIVWSKPDHLSNYSYYFMNEAGEFLNTLTFTTSIYGAPILSNDGLQIGYSSYSQATNGVEIFIGNVALSTPTQLTKMGLVSRDAHFFPGDNFLLYIQENGTDYYLYHVDSRGRNEVKITHTLRYPPTEFDVFVY